MKKLICAMMIAGGLLSSCTDADVASRNISRSAEMFEIDRRIVFYDAIQGVYLLVIEGKCSVDHHTKQVAVTCKTAKDQYKKHYLGISDNVTYFSEQVDGASVDVYRYRVIFKPKTLLPNVDVR